jgi:hypothetical protein
MGNKLKKQEKQFKSMRYTDDAKEFKRVKNTLNSRLFWECEYANRHVHSFRITDVDPLLYPADRIHEKFFNRSKDSMTFAEEYKVDMYMLIYAWHRSFVNDGFIDVRFEETLGDSQRILESLTPNEARAIKNLHELSYEYGVFILELCRIPSIMCDLLDKLLNNEFEFDEPLFLLPKKEDAIHGVEFYVKGLESNIKINWDVAFYVSGDERISHIKQELKEVWSTPSQITLGNMKNHKVAFFIERKKCTISYATNIIKIQMAAFKQYINKTPILLWSYPGNKYSGDVKEATKIQKKSILNLNEQVRISGKQINKNWSDEKGNIRRAVGLLIWDAMEENGSRAIEEIEKLFDSQLPKELFEVYYSRYNTPHFSGLSSTKDIVIRELYADIKLTERCIRDAKFYSPYDIKINKG